MGVNGQAPVRLWVGAIAKVIQKGVGKGCEFGQALKRFRREWARVVGRDNGDGPGEGWSLVWVGHVPRHSTAAPAARLLRAAAAGNGRVGLMADEEQ